jgi:hypothetical protein
MFNLLVADCDCPEMPSSFAELEARPFKVRIGEHPHGYCNQVGSLLSLPENRAPALWAEMKCHDPTAVRLPRIPLVSVFIEPSLLSREPCLTRTGSPWHMSRSCPQLHAASRFVIGLARKHFEILPTPSRRLSCAARAAWRNWSRARSAARRTGERKQRRRDYRRALLPAAIMSHGFAARATLDSARLG